MTTTDTLPPVAADLAPETPRPLRIEVVKTGDWPEPATLLGHAEDWAIAAQARSHWEKTGCQPAGLPGYYPAGG